MPSFPLQELEKVTKKKLTNNTKVAKSAKIKPTHPFPPPPSNKNGLSPPKTQLHLEKEIIFFPHPLPPPPLNPKPILMV
jgi:hypothetical protein